MLARRNFRTCSKTQVRSFASRRSAIWTHVCLVTANSFTPWFKLIARDFLFGWWDELYKRKNSDGHVVAKSLAGVADGSKVIKM